MTPKLAALLAALAPACAVAQATDAYEARWSAGASDSPGVQGPVACTEVVSHPCPWQLYTRTVEVDRGLVVWLDAGGGTDLAGAPASERPPLVDVPVQASTTLHALGSIALPQRGDDGGLRHAFQLVPTADGYEADVTWTLFNVAGNTTFHLDVKRAAAE